MLNSITFYVYNSLCNLILFISNLIGFKSLKNLIEVSLDRQKKSTLTLPHHIGIAFVEEDLISYRHIFDLILHSTTYGVKRITFYDPWSRIKSDKIRFIKDLRKYLKNSQTSIIPVFSDESDKVESNNRNIYLTILGANDGRGALVNACKKLCHLSREIKIEDVDEELQKQSIFEPDLLIKIGSIQSLAGYPPWSLRVTEILSLSKLSSDSKFAKSQFEEILLNFSTRDRRLGR
uniref:ditrans,polycis-polyprenyl diphosphate synthase [(2E,6E)-farnesyldiphosphate specific] n=1 Tax=Panagrolaimus superbus TaxID=310955 RepID=A0A914Y3X0_9BILA